MPYQTGDLLAAWAIKASKSLSSFEMSIGNLGANPKVQAPINLTLMAPSPSYTCSSIEEADPTAYSDIGGKRQVQAYENRIHSVIKIQCNADHMCLVRIHWHVMNNYFTHCKVKLTISNYNYKRNYSNWNVLIQHPGFSQSTTAYSFNSTMLPSFGISDEVALFWGIEYYNEELISAEEDEPGSVSTQILLRI
ncbi:5'-methylthioadenosine/S-adenosylhomocysteine nucleosidase 1-like [Hibiscus syriacus]|uniref:5'-methylthioadenosine/S-adenosylhomocysteine nucleosidase 1-like n=1 Tax=Hibiscus syriacus TaxID=106335 RepID=A0A6A3B203_HIBSY|nr:5'-methylthioadenosine/S-adenosylhomocysteine nucleosidase 1-like [Hibiscus syriacus]